MVNIVFPRSTLTRQKPDKMADNPGGKVALPALVTTDMANLPKQKERHIKTIV